MIARVLTVSQLTATLKIPERALNELVIGNKIPHEYADGSLRFNSNDVWNWMERKQMTEEEDKAQLAEFSAQLEANFPKAWAWLQEYGSHFSDGHGKGYVLAKVPNKKFGFLYYVRYTKDGKLVPSRWNTHTNDREAAERFAVNNRERLLNEYFNKKKEENQLYTVLSDFYQEGSRYLTIEAGRGRTMSDTTRKSHLAFIQEVLIPYYKKAGIASFAAITPASVTLLQDHLLSTGIKPQSVNRYISRVKTIFDHLLAHGKIAANPFRAVTPLKVKGKDLSVRGCYEIDSLKGVFQKKWPDEGHYLLSLLSYTTGMRNGEIGRIRPMDITAIEGVPFINIPESKTENGVRFVPLHPFVYEKIMKRIADCHVGPEAFIFPKVNVHVFASASREMGDLMGKRPEELKAQNITFYSGRSAWKTMINVEGLGDGEEYFMGHKVSSNVAKLYNHKDKVGRDNLLLKAREVFRILDKYLFTPTAYSASPPENPPPPLPLPTPV